MRRPQRNVQLVLQQDGQLMLLTMMMLMMMLRQGVGSSSIFLVPT